MTFARVVLESYSNKILNLVKVKYDLKDKSQALNKFIELYGRNELEPEVSDKYIKKVIEIEKRHFQKRGYNKMNAAELKELFEG